MTRLRHTNLVNALFYLPRPAVVLVPLLLKGLTLIVTLGVTAWLRSTWVDLCVLAAVIGYTLLRWSALRYALDGEVLRIREGIWFRKTTAIPAERISVVASVRPLLLRPFGVCLIEADTPAGSRGRADFRLYLSAGGYPGAVPHPFRWGHRPARTAAVPSPQCQCAAALALYLQFAHGVDPPGGDPPEPGQHSGGGPQ